jgi:Holliday junction resolvase RusA-like endonuclease
MIRARFFVAGHPATQGSKRIVQPKGHRRPMLIEQTSKTLKPWRTAVAAFSVIEHASLGQLDGPLAVHLLFSLKRPKKPSRPYPTADVDKLARAVLDALVHGGLVKDDSQVVQLDATKRWAIDEEVGCMICIEDYEP